MRASRITPLLLLSLAACGRGGSIEGIWQFNLKWAPTPDDQCVTDTLHNFNNVYTPEETTEESPWTETTDEDHSDAIFFGSVQKSGDVLLLTVGSAIFEGTEVANNQWSFRSNSYSSTSDRDDHASGYAFVTAVDEDADSFVDGLFDKGGFVGSTRMESTTVQTWTESDAWSAELSAEIGTTGRIPVSSYLLREYEGNIVPVVNNYDRNDCSSDPCTLSIASECVMEWDLSGHLTDLPPEGWDIVDGLEQGTGYQGP